MDMEREIEVTERSERNRYDLTVDGEFAGIVAYDVVGGVTVFTHTVMQDAFDGQGLASIMVDRAIADVAARGGTVATTCPFVRHWLTKNHQHDAIVVPLPGAIAGARLLEDL